FGNFVNPFTGTTISSSNIACFPRLPSLKIFVETALKIYKYNILREAPLKTSCTQQVFPMGQGKRNREK
ncbi:hypothetical protein ACQP3F_29795, partial [Escherichia coli]